jgi:hypothetical protein
MEFSLKLDDFDFMKLPFAGGCVCGEVRYECSSKPLIMLKCHCRDCQRVSGGSYTPVVVVPLKHFKITKGAVQYYATPSLAGGHNLRGFCEKCAPPEAMRAADFPAWQEDGLLEEFAIYHLERLPPWSRARSGLTVFGRILTNVMERQ